MGEVRHRPTSIVFKGLNPCEVGLFASDGARDSNACVFSRQAL